MCGLIGVVGGNGVVPVLVEGLRRLEYRGYDSVGVALLNGTLHVRRCVGGVRDLQRELQATADDHLLQSPLGIAHTRWATHGEPHPRNAHPHVSQGEVAVVHNGVIENHAQLRRLLAAAGYRFESETDSEVIAHLVHSHLRAGADLFGAVQEAVRQLRGSYAIAVVYARAADALVVARRGSNLLIGVGEDRQFVASDPHALLPWTTRVICPEEGDVVMLKRDDVSIADGDGRTAIRPLLRAEPEVHRKGPYRHYMLKEIWEQPRALGDFLEGRVSDGQLVPRSLGLKAPELLAGVRCVRIAGCGSSLHAAAAGQAWIEAIAGLPCQVDAAYRFESQPPIIAEGTLFIAISQSGETPATLAALHAARGAGAAVTLAICNRPDSRLMQEADLALATRAGPEQSVPATKTFTSALSALLFLAGLLAGRRARRREAEVARLLYEVPGLARAVLQRQDQVVELAMQLAAGLPVSFVGAGPLHALAREAALKCGEAACLAGSAFEMGELPHGPVAALAPGSPLLLLLQGAGDVARAAPEMQAAAAAGLRLFVIGPEEARSPGVPLLVVPSAPLPLAVFPHAVILQLLAYHLGVIRGTDIDQPRHLSKRAGAA